MDSTDHLKVDTLLAGRYCVQKVLGQGGMGAVYLAHDQSLGGKPVAIKEMRISAPDDKAQQQALKQFRQEAQFLANLEHPNLVQVFDFFAENGRHYLVMALIKGQSLGDMLAARKGAFPLSKVLDWARQLCTVLTYLHNQEPPILFRDLKPSNIMLDNNGTIRLIDFGIARSHNPEGVTATFMQGMGSAGYSPMEQYQGAGGTDPRSDIYALGATLFHLLTNQVPPSPIELVTENKSMPSPRRWNPTLPTQVEQILLKMMAMRKEERYQKVEQVHGLLEHLARNLEQSSDEPGTANLPSPTLGPPDSGILAGAPTLATPGAPATSPMPQRSEAQQLGMVFGAAAMVLLAMVSLWAIRPKPQAQSTPLAGETPRPAEMAAQPAVPAPVPASAPVQPVAVPARPAAAEPVRPVAVPAPAPRPVASRPAPPPVVEQPRLPDAKLPGGPSIPTARVTHRPPRPSRPEPLPQPAPVPAAPPAYPPGAFQAPPGGPPGLPGPPHGMPPHGMGPPGGPPGPPGMGPPGMGPPGMGPPGMARDKDGYPSSNGGKPPGY